MTHYDVVVVGAGPAGSTAARALAQGGARVCLVDKARFPRPKPCGGALSPRTLRHLPHGFEKMVRTQVRRFEKQKGQVQTLQTNLVQHLILKRDLQTNEQLYQALLARMKEASVASSMVPSKRW